MIPEVTSQPVLGVDLATPGQAQFCSKNVMESKTYLKILFYI